MRKERRIKAAAGARRTYPVEVYIDELALYGFSASAKYSIAEAVEQELTRLLMEQGLPPRWAQAGDVNRLDAGRFDIGHEVKPKSIGRQVAQAVYGSRER